MNGRGSQAGVIIVLLLILTAPCRGEIVVNEVLANEPGGFTTLEWIELYNTGDSGQSLDGCGLAINGAEPLLFPSGTRIGPEEYLILCRRLYPGGSSCGFEGQWGDSSGVWGDCVEEQGIPTPLEIPLALSNSSGSVELVDAFGTVLSGLGWSEAGADGCSWERVTPGADSVAQAVDSRGSTPGRLNSATPVANDLALAVTLVRARNGEADVTFVITNPGFDDALSRNFMVLSEHEGDTIDFGTLAPLRSGERQTIDRSYLLTGATVQLVACLPQDDRSSNNRVEFAAPGDRYSSPILSEVLANPSGGLATEWVEVYNPADMALSLSGWFLGDCRSLTALADDSAILPSMEYLVVADDTMALRDWYGSLPGLVCQPGSWPALNNDGDCVRLIDEYGIEADRFEYVATFAENITWCREPEWGAPWGYAAVAGGTPGAANRVCFDSGETDFGVTVNPRVFSPDGDGRDDSATIAVTTLPGEEYTLRIYDRDGRIVRTFAPVLFGENHVWHGMSNAGGRLPIGIYIIYAEREDRRAAKQTVVIAR